MIQWFKNLFKRKPKVVAPVVDFIETQPAVTTIAAPAPKPAFYPSTGERVNSVEGEMLRAKYQRPAPAPYKANRVTSDTVRSRAWAAPSPVVYHTETVHNTDSGPDLLTTMLIVNALADHNQASAPSQAFEAPVPTYQPAEQQCSRDYDPPAPAPAWEPSYTPSPAYESPAPSPSYEPSSSYDSSSSYSSSDNYSSSSNFD